MNILKSLFFLTTISLAIGAFSIHAKVSHQSDSEFTIKHSFIINKSVSTTHHEFSHIGRWWTSEYSMSGNGNNMYFAGKCFCETMPNEKAETVMTFIERKRNKSAVLSGAIGPLRGKNVKGLMSWDFEKDHHGTKVTVVYKVSGQGIAKNKAWPAELDVLLEKQMSSFKASLRKR